MTDMVVQQSDNILGARIAGLRRAMGLRQVDLAARAGCSQHTLQLLERGWIANPGVWYVVRIAAVLGVLLDDLVAACPLGVPRPEVADG